MYLQLRFLSDQITSRTIKANIELVSLQRHSFYRISSFDIRDGRLLIPIFCLQLNEYAFSCVFLSDCQLLVNGNL